jgi:phenylacetate-CoA ligase
MFWYSVKFSLRGFLRDLARGMLARNILYPHLAMNERSIERLAQYVRHVAGFIRPNFNALAMVRDLSDCIDKNNVRSDPETYIRSRSLATLVRNRIKTSGTTGQALTITQDYWAVVREEAFVYRQLRWIGYHHRDRRVWLRGDIVCSSTSSAEVYGCRDWWSNTLMLSSYHISTRTASRYVDSIARFDPVLIQGYPSSMYALASWMVATGTDYRGSSLRGVVTSSETLTPEMRECIERAFNCRVFDWYGQAERVTAIGTCEYGGRHVLTDYGLVELIAVDDGLHELVGTGYNNRAMPLVRYRTGDRVALALGPETCPCGRVFPLVERVVGRSDKTITLSDGRKIGRLDHVFKGMENVVEGQVAYRGGDHFVLRVVPGPRWSGCDAEILVMNLVTRVSNVTAVVEVVDSIPRGANGKFEFVRIEESE